MLGMARQRGTTGSSPVVAQCTGVWCRGVWPAGEVKIEYTSQIAFLSSPLPFREMVASEATRVRAFLDARRPALTRLAHCVREASSPQGRERESGGNKERMSRASPTAASSRPDPLPQAGALAHHQRGGFIARNDRFRARFARRGDRLPLKIIRLC